MHIYLGWQSMEDFESAPGCRACMLRTGPGQWPVRTSSTWPTMLWVLSGTHADGGVCQECDGFRLSCVGIMPW
jgi:hypothetical protein